VYPPLDNSFTILFIFCAVAVIKKKDSGVWSTLLTSVMHKKVGQSSHISHVELRDNLFLGKMDHSNAVGLRLYCDAVSWPSRFGMEIVRPLRAPFAKGDEPCIIVGKAPSNHTILRIEVVVNRVYSSPHPHPLPPGERGFMRLFT
jgi:hypothetical protein